MTLPADAHIGSVSLTVTDLERSIAFYRDLLGFAVVSREGRTASLSANSDRVLLELLARRDAVPQPRRSTGLFHFAILNVIDYGMNAQEAVDAGRMHHQWLPDRISVERFGFSADTIKMLQAMGHTVQEGGGQGAAQVIVFNQKDNMLEGGVDRRPADGGAAGK